MKKKTVKKLNLQKSIIKKLDDLSKIKGGRDSRTISGHHICDSNCHCNYDCPITLFPGGNWC